MHQKNNSISKIIACVSQVAIYLIVKPLSFLLVRQNVLAKPNASFQMLLAINHPTKIDFLLALSALPLRTLLPMIPFSFIVANRFMERPILGRFIEANGGIPVQSLGQLEGGLPGARKHMIEGRNLVVFPEGKVQRRATDSGCRKGIKVLADEFQVPILPIYIGMPKHWAGRPSVVVGDAFRADGMSADQIMEQVYQLSDDMREECTS